MAQQDNKQKQQKNAQNQKQNKNLQDYDKYIDKPNHPNT